MLEVKKTKNETIRGYFQKDAPAGCEFWIDDGDMYRPLSIKVLIDYLKFNFGENTIEIRSVPPGLKEESL